MKSEYRNAQRIIIIGSLIGVFLLVLGLRGNSVMTPFERDEGEYAYSARLLLRGDVPYKESFLQKPPLIIYTYALGQLIDPQGLWTPRFLAILFVIGTIYLIGYIAGRHYGWIAGIAAMWIAAPMISFPYLASLAANTEIFMLLPLTGVVAIFIHTNSQPHISHRYTILAGFLAATSLLYKPIAIFPLLFLFMIWFIQVGKRSKTVSVPLWLLITWGIGCALSFILFLGYFLLRGAGPALWESVVEFNRHYATFFGLGLDYFSYRLSIFFTKWTPLFPLFLWALCIQIRKSWLFAGLCLGSLLGVFQTPIGHYYLLVMPFWAMVAGGAIQSIALIIEQKSHVVISLFITGIVVIYMIVGVGEQFGKSAEEMGMWIYGQGNPFLESVIIAQKLQAITTPDDLVFVAGSEPQILYYADRKSSTRFVITYPFVIKTPRQRAYQQEAIHDIETRPPKAIVLSQRDESGLWDAKSPQDFREFLLPYLKDKYTLVGGTIWGSDTFGWKGNLSKDDLSKASLLLFALK